MSQSEARAWWADVEDVRERIERRRESAAAQPAASRPALRAVPGGQQPDHDAVSDDATPAAPARRTVRINGRGAQPPAPRRLVDTDRRRPPLSPADRVAHRPDRIALWAVFLGAVLVLVAMASGHS